MTVKGLMEALARADQDAEVSVWWGESDGLGEPFEGSIEDVYPSFGDGFVIVAREAA